MEKIRLQQIQLIIKIVLNKINLYSDEAFNLVFFTGFHESKFNYLMQHPSKIAKGYFQIEKETHNDLFINFLVFKKEIMKSLLLLTKYHFEVKELENEELSNYVKNFVKEKKYEDLNDELVYNLYYSIAVCRLLYYRQPFKIDSIKSFDDIAKVWKQYYNTKKGKGSEKEFLENVEYYNKNLK